MKEKKIPLSQLQARILAIVILVLSLSLIAIGSYAVYLRLTLKEYELRIIELKATRPKAPQSGETTLVATRVDRGEQSSMATPIHVATGVSAVYTEEISEAGTAEDIVEEDVEKLIEELFEVHIPSFEFLVSNMRLTLDASECFSVTVESSPEAIYSALEASPNYLIDRISTDVFIVVKIEPLVQVATAVTETSESLSSTRTEEFFSLQLLAYYSIETALEKSFLLRSNGFPSFVYSYYSSSGRKWYAVELGLYTGLSNALKASREIPEDFIGKIIGHNVSDRFVRKIRSPIP